MHVQLLCPPYVLVIFHRCKYRASYPGQPTPRPGPDMHHRTAPARVAPQNPAGAFPTAPEAALDEGQGKHHRDERDIDAAEELQALLAQFRPRKWAAKSTRRNVLSRLEAEVAHLRKFGVRLTPQLRPRHDATFVIRGRVA